MSSSFDHAEMREAQFAAEVAELARTRGGDARRALIDLCEERHPAYQDQPASAVTRMRAWVLESLCRVGPLPDEALPFVLEELETVHDPLLLAVAASCLRTYPQPLPLFRDALSTALRNAQAMESPVMLGVYGGIGPAGGGNTSPMRELASTIEWMGPHPALPARNCCPDLAESIVGLFRRKTSDRSRASRRAVERVALEDQRGETRTYRERFRGQPSILVFFYTRCDNPLKCTLTLSKLSRVQRILEERGLFDQIRTAAITYDPAYDTPDRLLRYGRNRGFRVDSQHHVLLRATQGLNVLKRHFELGVSFFESIVSRHRIEVFVLDREGRIAFTFQRLNWGEEQAVDEAARLLTGAQAKLPSAAPLAGLAASMIPKCPMCWATYLSFLGVTGTLPILGPSALRSLAAALLTIHSILALRRVRAIGWHMAPALSLAGVAVIAVNLIKTDTVPGLGPLGAALMLIASIMTVRQQYARPIA
jgi:protein SCO1